MTCWQRRRSALGFYPSLYAMMACAPPARSWLALLFIKVTGTGQIFVDTSTRTAALVDGASNGLMGCAEYQQLEEAYIDAARLCALYAAPQSLVPPGKDQLARATALRRAAMAARNCAADSLHLHLQHCPLCKLESAG